jgi:glycine/D-amino acid oxidase-like deaminating enzyme
MSKSQLRGFNPQVLGNKELKDFHPYLRTEDLEGAIWVPEDAVAKPQAICKALAKLAKEGGL